MFDGVGRPACGLFPVDAVSVLSCRVRVEVRTKAFVFDGEADERGLLSTHSYTTRVAFESGSGPPLRMVREMGFGRESKHARKYLVNLQKRAIPGRRGESIEGVVNVWFRSR